MTPGSGEGALQDAKDVDVFTFPVEAGHVYRFSCWAFILSYQSTCVVGFLSSSGVPLTSSGVDWEQGFKAEADGVAYAAVRPSSSAPTYPLTYSYLLNHVGPADDDNTPETATLLRPGMRDLPGQIELAGDVDFFAFDAEADHVYRFDCVAQDVCALQLRDASGQALSEQQNSLAYEVKTAGRYTLRLRYTTGRLLSNYVGYYRYSLFDQGRDDHADGVEGATALTLGTPVEGRFESPGDRDVFRVTAPAGRVLRARCSTPNPQGNGTMRLHLMDGAGQLLAEGSGFVTHETGDAPGPLFLAAEFISDPSPRWPLAYSCQVEALDSP